MSIIDLPLEILCQIFQSTADFSAVNALARTSRALHSIWLANSPAIFFAVAVRALPNFSDAERLIAAQEEAHTAAGPNLAAPSLSRHERFLFNARCASAACKHWDEVCQVHNLANARGDNPALRPSERARFKRSFYHLWTLSTLSNTPSLRTQASEFLAACDPVELAGLDEIAIWAYGYNENEFGDSGLDFKDGTWNAALQMVDQYCAWDKENSGHRRVPVSGHEAPLSFWVFLDHTQHYLEWI
ncbi:MAG: hypothetical protein Q9172_007707 [Xanthocarpia lactea]